MNKKELNNFEKKLNYDDLIERGCLIIEIAGKNVNKTSTIPGALTLKVNNIKKRTEQLRASTRPILLTSHDQKSLIKASKQLIAMKIECYNAGSPSNCYEQLIAHQYVKIKTSQ